MKIFISGSRILKENIPDTVLLKIQEHIDEGADFLIGDCEGVDKAIQQYLNDKSYDNVTIYASGERVRNNIGFWKEIHCPIGVDAFRYSFYIEKDFTMAEDADCGLVIWDGNSKGSFVNMLNLIFMGKKCDLYLLNEERWMEVKNLDDLESYVGERSGWGESEIEQILTECRFSAEMKMHMMSDNNLSDIQLVSLICSAPISLKRKRDILENLIKTRNIKYEIFYLVQEKMSVIDFKELKKEIRQHINVKMGDSIWAYLWKSHKDIGVAIRALENFGQIDRYVLSLYEEWYDSDVLMEKSSNAGLFNNINDVISYIANEEKDNDTGEGWYRIELWRDNWEFLSFAYNFYTIGSEVCWFEKMHLKEAENGNKYPLPEQGYYGSNSYVNQIETPYKTGDIIRVDCRPFAPPFNAMILQDKYQCDSCFPNILFKVPYTDEWRLEPLKSGRFFYDSEVGIYVSPISVLYGVRLIDSDDELKEFKDMIDLTDAKNIKIKVDGSNHYKYKQQRRN